MRLKTEFLAGLLFLGLCGCDADYQLNDLSDFTKMCALSGGTAVDGLCTCGGVSCDDGRLCDIETKKCMADYIQSGDCTDGASFCLNGHLQTCTDGIWSEAVECDSKRCIDTEKCAERCTDSICENGKMKICENGIYKNTSPCTYGCDVAWKECAMSPCDTGALRCSNDISAVCIDSAWSDEKKCKLGCDDNTTRYKSECDPGMARCYEDNDGNGTQESCIDGVLTVTPCTDDKGNSASCAGTVCGNCKNTESFYTCKNDENRIGKPARCRSGVPVYEECINVSCDDEVPGNCGNCRNGDAICRDDPDTGLGMTGICAGGRIFKDLSSPCEGNFSCLTENLCGFCLNGHDTSCENRQGVGYVITCKNGSFPQENVYQENDSAHRCADDVSCNEDLSHCGLCRDESTKCDDSGNGIFKMYECKHGSWNESKTCETGCIDEFQC